MLISIDQLEQSETRYAALENKPAREAATGISEEALIADVPPEITKGNIIGTEENMDKRKQMLETIGREPVDFALERAIGRNDSVYSNFIELISDAKQKVGRIFIKDGNKKIGFATGFMVSGQLMLTNWHVFKTKEEVADSEIQFFYEYDKFGNQGTPVSFKLQAGRFYHSNKELDYCLVAVNTSDTTGTRDLAGIGYIWLDPALGKLGNEEEEALNIIHHPDGDFKQLSIRENLFKKITPTSIWYETDTAPGSSGSPVFNDQWQVVALHHMGVGRKNAAGKYIDKDGNPVPEINGKIDASKVVWEANEGIRISVILKDIFTALPGSPFINELKIKPGNGPAQENKTGTIINATNNTGMNAADTSGDIRISFPASLVERNGVINIRMDQGTRPAPQQITAGTVPVTGIQELDTAEIKKLEETTDFSACKGYQSRFLGTKAIILFPQPQPSIRKFIAKLKGTDGILLRYYQYSTIFHSVRMMPLISGINVDGDPRKRKDTSERKDVWLRDNRIDFDIQLGDAYYRGSGFDRGHMSRREDANWGATAAEAKRNADLTCMYTNACPQVAKLNQSGKQGLWGILEKVVLEAGAMEETGRTGKITVFNGPIFKEDDPVFRGIQVPMDFYKIVCWLTDDGSLKATAFKLSQVEDVGDIDFEALDIDQNTTFKEYQCSISSLQKETRIDFSGLVAYDTFEGNEGEERTLINELDVRTHISRHNKA